jgi:hypothetical protein
MEFQVAEITPETCKVICHWMERALLRLGVPPTYVTYRAEYVPTVTGQMVLCMVVVLPHLSLLGFKGEVCYSTLLTVATALDVACRQALGCPLAQYRATIESETLRLLPRDYWHLAPLVDGVPSHEGSRMMLTSHPSARPMRPWWRRRATWSTSTSTHAAWRTSHRPFSARSEMPPSTPVSTRHVVFSWRERTAHYTYVFASSSRTLTARPPSCCSLRGSVWTPGRSCYTSGRTSVG